MDLRRLGKTRASVTAMTLGTWGLAERAYGPVEPGTLEATIEAAFEAGVRSFDAAPLWGEGESEAAIGRVLGAHRDACTLITRAGIVREDGRVLRRFDRDAVHRSVEASLRRFASTRIDLLLLHDPRVDELMSGSALRALADLSDEKIIGAYGICVSTREQVDVALLFGAKVLVLTHNLLAGDLLPEISDQLVHAGVVVLARSPLFHGLLADRMRPSYGEDDHRRERFPGAALAERQRHAAILEGLVGDEVPSLGAAALRYALSGTQVVSAIVGARSPEQVRTAAGWLEGGTRLSVEKLERVPQLLALVGA